MYFSAAITLSSQKIHVIVQEMCGYTISALMTINPLVDWRFAIMDIGEVCVIIKLTVKQLMWHADNLSMTKVG